MIAVTAGTKPGIVSVEADMSVALSGPFDTSQLPRIAGEPVTVTVARSIRSGREEAYSEWADDALDTLAKVDGCLGAGVLNPGPSGGDHQLVFRFVDGVSLRAWERSPERAALMARAREFVVSERVTRTVGVENFFELPERAEPQRSWWGRIVTDVAWVYPVAIVSSIVVAPRIAELPMELRVVISSLLITAVMRLAVGPLRSKLRAKRTL